MIVISCVDSGLRILSHECLKKQYPQILQQMLQLTGNSKLWMNHTSAVLFDGMDANQVNVDEAFLNEAAPGEYCLVEEVDLSSDYDTAVKVGSRHGSPVVYQVDTAEMDKDGYDFFLSANGVWLTKVVPAKYLKKCEPDPR